MPLMESGEMYLETILLLRAKRGQVRSVDVAEHMGFSKPSVSRAVGILKEDGYVLMDRKGLLTLTEKGEEAAGRIYRRHLLLTEVLCGLGVDPAVAEADACRIEHVISEETFEALCRHRKEKTAEETKAP
ncbi:MAG: metal-dependent transcriptional regulator [Clostridia bacterium]|nr:metal-dependent transcriptional regulator [Clostridia bacterium]